MSLLTKNIHLKKSNEHSHAVFHLTKSQLVSTFLKNRTVRVRELCQECEETYALQDKLKFTTKVNHKYSRYFKRNLYKRNVYETMWNRDVLNTNFSILI